MRAGDDMSAKRAATTELNHDNWDQDDPAEQNDMGTYTPAPKEVLEKRVIKTARRRTQMSGAGDEAKKSVFSAFGGFNKTQPSSFDFLSNLTNGTKTNGSSANKNENTVSSSIFTNSSLVSGSASGLFSIPASKADLKTTPAFGTASTPSLFGISSSSMSTSSTSPFKADSTVVDSPFNKQSSISRPETGGFQLKSSSNMATSQVSSTIATTTNKTLFSSSTTSPGATPFKIQSVSSTTTTNNFGANPKAAEKKKETTKDPKAVYYSKLKGLNESVSDWIQKHVKETPLCFLTPIFVDYEKYLKEIQDEYHDAKDEEVSKKDTAHTTTPVKNTGTYSSELSSTPKPTSSLFSSSSPGSNNLFTSKEPSEQKPAQPFSFGIKTSTSPATSASSAGFTFGIKPPANDSSDKPPERSSPFGTMKSPFTAEKSAAKPFSLEKPAGSPFFTHNTAAGSTAPAPFSFGANIQQNTGTTCEQNDEDDSEPPKVEFTPVVEENSVFDKCCKIFVKKDGNYADKGVGTLYIKKIENSAKYQLIVRANTNLGTLLVNLVLASAIPTQRLGKNNVMMVCIPTPEANPPPTPVLIRVKTSEEADELLETINKFKA